MKENSIRRAVREGRAALGTGLKEFASRGVPWIIEASGFDYCMIDHEHGAFDLETIADLAGWFQATDVSAIVRIHKSFTYLIPAILDQGIMGIQVSEVDNAEEARAIAQVAKYPPIGDRGISGQGMHTGYRSYGARHASEYAPWANANIIVCVSIEAAASSAHHSTAACDPDRIVDHFPPTCDNCAQPLPQSAGTAMSHGRSLIFPIRRR